MEYKRVKDPILKQITNGTKVEIIYDTIEK